MNEWITEWMDEWMMNGYGWMNEKWNNELLDRLVDEYFKWANARTLL